MSADANFLDITLLGREYRVACPPEERDGLLAAVHYLGEKMAEVANKQRNATTERIAVMAALNIAHEMVGSKSGSAFDSIEAKRRIKDMEATLDDLLKPQEPLF